MLQTVSAAEEGAAAAATAEAAAETAGGRQGVVSDQLPLESEREQGTLVGGVDVVVSDSW